MQKDQHFHSPEGWLTALDKNSFLLKEEPCPTRMPNYPTWKGPKFPVLSGNRLAPPPTHGLAPGNSESRSSVVSNGFTSSFTIRNHVITTYVIVPCQNNLNTIPFYSALPYYSPKSTIPLPYRGITLLRRLQCIHFFLYHTWPYDYHIYTALHHTRKRLTYFALPCSTIPPTIWVIHNPLHCI